jgi:FkbM family methyltransferase
VVEDPMLSLTQAVKSGLRQLGFELQRLPRSLAPDKVSVGLDPYHDMRRLTGGTARPVVFDVGANVGQSIERIRTYFEHPTIHAFEPGPDTFEQLRRATEGVPDLVLNNVAFGRQAGIAEFVVNSESVLSSLLDAGPDIWGTVKGKIPVTVATLDEYCASNNVERIDVLKLDTQGFEMEVLKGGENMLRQGRIAAIFMEVTFSEMYKNLPSLDEIYRFMTERGYYLVAFYDFHYKNNRLGWCDAMFAYRG